MVRSGLLVCLLSVLAVVDGAQTAWAQSYDKAATLSVTPAEGLTSNGSQGGPFTPSSRSYSVANTGDGLLAWAAVSNQGWVTVQMAPTGNGTKLMVGSQFATSGTVSIPLSLYRGPDTAALEGASSITAVVTYDSEVLQFQGISQASQLADWYDKGLVTGEATPGRVNIVITGSNQYNITTYDNQMPGGTASNRINPFPLGTLRFSIVGSPGDSSALGVADLVMVNGNAVELLGVTSQPGFFSVSTMPGSPSQFLSGPGVATVSLNSSANSLGGGTHAATISFVSNGGSTTRPVSLTVTQSCTTPLAPGQVQASDGDFSAYARVTWAASSGATQYQVYRSEGTDPTGAQALSGWITGTSYNDTTAAAPSSGGGGCSSAPGFTYYNYWVRAQNACGTSPYSAPNSGYRGSGAKSAKSESLIESALPASGIADDLLSAEPASPLALRLVATERLAPQSLRANVEAFAGATATWEPHWADDARSVWIVFTPEETWTPGEVVTLSAGAVTVSGTPVNALVTRFEIAVASAKSGAGRLWQPIPGIDYTGDSAEAISEAVPTSIEAEEAVPEFAEGRGEPVRIGPAQVFSAPQRIWLPVPQGVDPDELVVYYYHEGGDDRGWYVGDKVQGWMVPGSVLRLDLADETYVGLLVEYGGVAQLGLPVGQAGPSKASVVSLARGHELVGDLSVFALAMAVLIWRGRRVRCRS